jgi:hypothetical protein
MARRGRKTGSVSVDKLIAELSSLDARRRDIVAAIKAAIAPLGTALQSGGVLGPKKTGRRPGFKMSAAAKAKIAAAQRARWARVKKKAQDN